MKILRNANSTARDLASDGSVRPENSNDTRRRSLSMFLSVRATISMSNIERACSWRQCQRSRPMCRMLMPRLCSTKLSGQMNCDDSW